MISRTWVCVTLVLVLMTSCGGGRTGTETGMQDSMRVRDTLVTDSVAEVE